MHSIYLSQLSKDTLSNIKWAKSSVTLGRAKVAHLLSRKRLKRQHHSCSYGIHWVNTVNEEDSYSYKLTVAESSTVCISVQYELLCWLMERIFMKMDTPEFDLTPSIVPLRIGISSVINPLCTTQNRHAFNPRPRVGNVSDRSWIQSLLVQTVYRGETGYQELRIPRKRAIFTWLSHDRCFN